MPFTFHWYLMQTASVNSCLCSVYPIALIDKADSQEDAPFSTAPFVSCCDSGFSSFNSSSRLFWHFALFACHILFFVCLVNSWSERLLIKIEFLSVDFVSSSVIWIECLCSVLAVFRGSVRPSPPCLKGRAGVCLSASLVSCLTRGGIINHWWRFPVVWIIHSYLALFFGNWIQLEHNRLNVEHAAWWSYCMYFEATEGLLPNLQPCFQCIVPEWVVPITGPG